MASQSASRRFKPIIYIAVLVLGCASITAAAHATVRPSGDVISRWNTNHSSTVVAAAETPTSDLADSLRVARNGYQESPQSVAPVSDNANSLALHRLISRPSLAATTPAATGFVWSDAGIGAAATCLLILMLATSAALVRRHRQITA